MSEAWLEQAADAFWSTVGGPAPFPRDLEGVISTCLPLSIVALPQLRIRGIESWFADRNIPFRFLCYDRALCGCIVAARGHGFLFIDAADPSDERRFTVAHETAHFLLDYVHPRQRVIDRFGDAIRPVLDGQRDPTWAESMDAVLSGVTLGTYVDLLPRSSGGEIDTAVILRAEARADRLALELLAPAGHVVAQLGGGASPRLSLETMVELLVCQYGLPRPVAQLYATRYLQIRATPSTAEWLGL
jgi:hypothetical protein